MSVKLTAPLVENVVVGDGYTIRFAAVDPTTGADVAGVTVTNVNIDGDAQGSDSGPLSFGPYMLVGGPNA